MAFSYQLYFSLVLLTFNSVGHLLRGERAELNEFRLNYFLYKNFMFCSSFFRTFRTSEYLNEFRPDYFCWKFLCFVPFSRAQSVLGH